MRALTALLGTEPPYIVYESFAAGLTLSIGFQLARAVETFGHGPAGQLLATRMSEPTWATLCIIAGVLPFLGLSLRMATLRWLALVVDVGLYSVMAVDFHATNPDGLLWLFAIWLSLGCAAGSIRLANKALRGPIRELYYRLLRKRLDSKSRRIDSAIARRNGTTDHRAR